MVIHELFPTVVGEYNLGRNFSEQEKEIFRSLNEMEKNIGNLNTVNKNVLDIEGLKSVKDKIIFCSEQYINKIINPKNKIVPYVTQSWINFTNMNQYHHKHNHSNSLLSGVMYIYADSNIDRITFHDNRYYQINLPPKNYTRINSSSWDIGVKTNDIFIFPSHLVHEVKTSSNENPRISLAFNIFISGIIGEKNDMTELVLK